MGRLPDSHARIDALVETINIGGMESETSLPGYTGCLSELKIDNIHVSLMSSVDSVVSVRESVGVVTCGDLTPDLMVSDQAVTTSPNTFSFDGKQSVSVMNR